ncbi:MAG: NADP-dependent oxidoreductase, partial [Ruegeria sp.]
MSNRQIVVASLPQGALSPEHFELQETPMPTPQDGEVLLRTILMSIDAANRSWMQGATYREAVHAGDPMPTYAICEVVESASPRTSPGDIVAAESVWADHVTR